MSFLQEIYCKVAITALLIAVFAINHPPYAVGNGLKVLAVAVVAILALYVSAVARGRGRSAGKPFAYLLAIAALVGILWSALAIR
jgi:hypothetical protein